MLLFPGGTGVDRPKIIISIMSTKLQNGPDSINLIRFLKLESIEGLCFGKEYTRTGWAKQTEDLRNRIE